MKKKSYIILVSTILLIGLSGCNAIEKKSSSSSYENKTEYLDKSYQMENSENQVDEVEEDGQSELPTTTPDGIISFSDEVNVASPISIAIYDADTHTVTLNEQYKFSKNCKYLYVQIDSISSAFLLQKVTSINVDDKGRYTAILSGIPLIEDMNSDSFKKLFVSYNLEGDENLDSIDNTKLPTYDDGNDNLDETQSDDEDFYEGITDTENDDSDTTEVEETE